MLRVRTTKTGSKATAVQVVRYEYGRTVLIKHIGSSKDEKDIPLLKTAAFDFIEQYTGQEKLLDLEGLNGENKVIQLDKIEYLGTGYIFIYETLTHVFNALGFGTLGNQMLRDIVIMRIITPASKLETIALLSELFGVSYGETELYRSMPKFALLKTAAEKAVVEFAKKQFSFDFSLVFYDVTTLYFESFKQDEDMLDEKGEVIQSGLRKPGFSKDNKSNQPQIVIGLIVTKEGFPVSFDIFEGNTFEGNTFIPSIVKFKEAHNVKALTVVADAAMISLPNVESLIKHKLSYIVGARIANLKLNELTEISTKLGGIDKTSIRVETERGLLVCDFSETRYRKDKWEMEKQITKANKLLEKNQGLKRTKFIKNKGDNKTEQILNTELIEKTKLLLGIKGYYTNLTNEANETIINHYHNLWHVEKAFRIAKSDLEARPIFHHKRENIEAHILICFMALAICKYMELKTKKSTRKIIKLLKSITDARIKNKLTGEIIIMRKELSEEIRQLWKTLCE